ncbi:glutathione S-transferase family protein [Sphingobium sufflavum]|uniref:glutathione S-transferase family protein n=1 Tax=Sphingobium sufflavum TaxID=1129547 RepID=UPI001F2D32F8|nr:glutathione S-transferase family protein [Sphingobium sufflavum]MCE7796129.1 glutathione S-transferase family protein [Sphingobium sufflavum]
MARYRLISFKACPWVQRAAIVLREKQVEFDFVHIESGNRPDWFSGISPHGKVPVLQIDDGIALFESNAIAEHLDEAAGTRLHPEDPVTRAINRAWTDYIPSFSAATGAVVGAPDAEAHGKARAALATIFGRLEEALVRQQGDGGPFFNGERYSLVDAGYAPFLQRYLIVEDLSGDRLIADYPRLQAWATALVERASTHTFPPEEFRGLYTENLKKRGGYLLQEALQATVSADMTG